MCGRYNLSAPTRPAPVVLEVDGQHILKFLNWGFKQDWLGKLTINARSDKLLSSKLWQSVWNRGRCLVPANSFYEWKGEKQKSRERFTIGPRDPSHLWAFAGLIIQDSFVIITNNANPSMLQIHHRQPALVLPEKWDFWLNPESSYPESAIHVFSAGEMLASGNFLF